MQKNDKVFVLTIPRAKERIEKLEEEFKTQGIKNFEIVYGFDYLENKGMKPHVAVSNGHKQIVRDNYELPYITVFEDDVKFTSKKSWEYYVQNFKYLPEWWDVYLGGVYRPRHLSKIEGLETIMNCNNYCGLHFYTIRKQFYDKFLTTPDKAHIDKWIYRLGAASFICDPIPSIQRGVYSYHKNLAVDYSGMDKDLNLLTDDIHKVC